MPLSEEEQRILQEMEQKLREHDRDFVDRVSRPGYRVHSTRGAKWAAAGFVAGTVLLGVTFRSSVALGICAVLVMVVSALAFASQFASSQKRPHAEPTPGSGADGPPIRRRERPGRAGLADEWSEMRRRMRSRFGNRD